MKKLIFSLFCGFIALSSHAQQSMTIGESTIKSNAVLWLYSPGKNQGFIVPIVSNKGNVTPDAAMIVFDDSDRKLYYNNGSAWIEVSGGTGGSTTSEADGIIGNEVTQINTARGGLELSGTGTSSSPLSIGLIPGLSDGQILKWDDAGKRWILGADNSGASPAMDNTSIGTNLSAQLEVKNLGVTTVKLANNAVDGSKILDGAITNSDLANNAAVAVSKLTAGTSGQVLTTNVSGVPTWSSLPSGGTVTNVSATAPISITNPTTTPQINLPRASGSVDGYLSSADWSLFNSKQNTLTTGALSSSTPGITLTGATGAVVGTGTTINIQSASSTQNGLLRSADFTTFNNKQNALTFGTLATSTPGVTVTGGTNAVVGTGSTINIQSASATQDGLLQSADWNMFNNKQNALTTGALTTSTPGVSITGGTGAVIGSGATLDIQSAGTSQDGLLTSGDWNTFNNKQSIFTNADVIPKGSAGGLVPSSLSESGGEAKVSTFSAFGTANSKLTLTAAAGLVVFPATPPTSTWSFSTFKTTLLSLVGFYLFEDHLMVRDEFNNTIYAAFGQDSFLPGATNTYDLGNLGNNSSGAMRWRNIYLSNNPNVSSDLRLKENVKNLNYGLQEVLRMRPVSYRLTSNKDQRTSLGLIAQEVRELVPEIVREDDSPDKLLSMSYTDLIPVLIKAIQEQQTTIDSLKAELKESKANEHDDLAALKKEIKEIKALLSMEAEAKNEPKD